MIPPPTTPNELRRLKALREIGQLDTPLEERFERITRLAQRSLQAPIAALSLIDSDRQWFKSVQGLSIAQTTRNNSFCGHTILQKDVMIVSDARKDDRFADNPFVVKSPNIVFYAGCPVRARDGSPIGALCIIDREARSLSEDERQLLRDLAAVAEDELAATMQAGAQRELIDQVDEVRRQWRIDPLTRIWNRESVFELLDAEIARACRGHTPVAVIMADLDRFKAVNDTLGHAAGDEVLRIAAKRILESIREVDSLGRYGGEEFLIVLGPCESVAAVRAIAERIRSRIDSEPISTPAGPKTVTLSLGVAFCEQPTRAVADALIQAADRALYAAKRNGRNRVEFEDVDASRSQGRHAA